ncbi:hypothetical protein RDABS01_016635 [Bienertia sinuspersici]
MKQRLKLMAELGALKVYSCYNCRNQVYLPDDIIFKAFQKISIRFWRTGVARALLCYNVDPPLTGLHTVDDIYCADYRLVLGWKYLCAYESSQKYKEGKFIFNKSKIVKEDW